MEDLRGATVTMTWTDGHRKEVSREVNQLIDVRDFIGTPGYSMLLVAANTRLSGGDIERFLALQSQATPGVRRSPNWIRRRRWMFQPPGTDNTSALRRDADGNGARAVELMAAHPGVSIRELTELLKREGIMRSREWVRQHRCDGVSGNQHAI